MKLIELVELGYDQRVALESTMNQVDKSTQVYTVPDALHHYMQLKLSDKDNKKAKNFLNDLVEYED